MIENNILFPTATYRNPPQLLPFRGTPGIAIYNFDPIVAHMKADTQKESKSANICIAIFICKKVIGNYMP